MKVLLELNLFHFIAQLCTDLVYSCTITNTVHLTEVWLAQTCSVSKWNFVYSSLSYSVIGSLIIFIFPLFRLSIIQTIHFTLHKFWWSKVDCSHMYFWMYLCVGESWTWLPLYFILIIQSAKSEVSTNYQDQDSSLKTNI